jgi:hypothetical protein
MRKSEGAGTVNLSSDVIDSKKQSYEEIKRIREGAFDFILVNNGDIRVSSYGMFVDLKSRPELKKRADELFKEYER